MNKERRVLGRDYSPVTLLIETRADGKEYIVGKAVVFGEKSQLLGGWMYEIIDSRAFDGCDMSDVVGKFNHDENFTLGRTPSLLLEIRTDGLYYAIPYDGADPDHVKVRRKIERGDVRGSSFEFTVAVGGATWEQVEGQDFYTRTVTKIDKLYDVAPVVFPAYLQTDTSIAKRGFESLQAEQDSLRAEQQQQSTENQQVEAVVTVTPLSIRKHKQQILKHAVTR